LKEQHINTVSKEWHRLGDRLVSG